MRSIYKRLLKRALLATLIIHLSFSGFAASYYVSNAGNDSNSGLASTLPWKTLAKVNSFAFKAGDQILFQRGSVFYGSLTVINSGTTSSPIVYGAYGTGSNPVITGFTAVDTWTNLGNNIWESTNAISGLTTCNMVSVNDINTPMGRYPNSNAANGGYLTFQSHSGNTSITSSSLTGTPNWSGAEVVIRPNRWILNRCTISSQSASTIVFSPATSYAPIDGFGFFIQKDLKTLDQQNEWYYNPTTKKISIYSSTQPANVKVASIEDLLTITASYITVENISFTGANDNAITGNSIVRNNITIRNCSMTLIGGGVISGLRSQNYLIDSNYVSDGNNNGISAGNANNVTIQNNVIQNIGLYPGMGSLIYAALSVGDLTKATIQYNKVINSGYIGISFYGDSVTVRNNLVDTFCKVLDDGGGIYTYTGSKASMKAASIVGNIVINGVGAINGSAGNMTSTAIGIYLDNNSKNVEIDQNTIAHCNTYGMLMNNPSFVNIHDNMFYNNSPQIRSSYMTGSNPVTNNTVSNNSFVVKTSSQGLALLISSEENLSNFGTIENNHYGLINESSNLFTTSQPSALYKQRSYSGWVSYLSKDLSSRKLLIPDYTTLLFEYNASTSPKTVSLPYAMIDVKGTKYASSVTLQPYTSVVLMKDPNPTPADVIVPVVTAFTIPATSTLLTISISNLNASDNIGVTGYLLTETSTKPASTATGWSLTQPTSYTFASIGTKSLYAWAKDAAGNVSASLKADIVISVPAATAFTLNGPSSGNVNTSSANFSVTPNNLYTGSITITPTGSGSTGLSAKVLTFTNSMAAQTFTITPTVAGSITLTATNNGSLANPSNLNYTVNATVPGAPTTVSAIAGNTTATVTFVAPLNNGGTSDLTYSVTSIPAGGTDINAGSASLSHTITGLTNGTSYTFTVKATNIAGTSVSSTPSNSVTPVAISSTEYKSICDGSSYNGWTVTGKYQRTLIAKSGGDSIAITYLTVNPKYSVNEDITINSGESYNGWTATGQYSRTLSSKLGCDSIVTTNLTVVVNSGKQDQIPSHFVPVWQGQSGISLMNFSVNSALLEDLQLGANDEIAVFSGFRCVGSGKLTQTINPADQSTYLNFQASQNDGTGNGYTLNDTIIFKIWDSKNQKEEVVRKVTYQQGLPPVITTGRYTIFATAKVSIESYTEYTQTISLKQGNNMFSTYIIPNNPDLSKVVKPLCDLGKLYKIQDESGLSFEYWGSYGGWINKIGNVEKTESYNINVTSDCTLNIVGRMVSLPLNIPLKKGWNFISFPATSAVNAMSVVQSLIDLNKLIKVQDEAGNSIEKLKRVGWVNNIGNFIPGKGYKVYVSANTSLTIQENYSKSANMLAETNTTEYFRAQYEGNGISHMNINMIGLAESGLAEGDELAAFDGEICVGTLKITEEHLLAGTASLISSYSTNEQNKDGFTNGNQIILFAWNKNTGEKTEVHAELLDGTLTFAQNASTLINLNNLTTGTNQLSDQVTIDVYPNPSKGNFTVRLNELPEIGSKIDILDNTGRLIASRQITDQSEAFNLDNPTSGLYFVKTTLGTKSMIQKLIVNK